MWIFLSGFLAAAVLLILIWLRRSRAPGTPTDVELRKQVDAPALPKEPSSPAYRLDPPTWDSPEEFLLEQPQAPVQADVESLPPLHEDADKPQHRKEPRFELIPHKMGGINARTVLSDETWARLSKMVIDSNAGKCCECANDPPTRMECHEVWKYEWEPRPGRSKKVGVMRLVGLRPLCHLCHMGKHIKYAQSQGELPEVTSHLMRLYPGLNAERVRQLMVEAVAKSELKYKYEELDLSYLNDARFAWIRDEFGRDFTTNEMPRPVTT